MTFTVSQTLARAAALSALLMSATLLGLNTARAAGEEQPAAPAAEEAAPAANGEAAAPAEAAPAEEAAPAAETAAPAEEAPPAAAETPKAEEAPAAAEAPAAPAEETPAAEAPAAAAVAAGDLAIGTPVVGSDGVKIGEINRVNSDANGNVTEIHVTDGKPAGLGVPVRAIPVGQIASGGKEVKVSISAADAAKLPLIGGDKS